MKIKALKFFGWLCVPYIMIIIFWRKIGKTGKIFGISWTIIVLLMVVTSKEDDKQLTKPVNSIPLQSSQEDKEKAKAEKEEAAITKKKEREEKAKLDAEQKEEKAKADAEAKKAEEEKNKPANQEAVIAFEKTAFDLEATAKPIFNNYQNIMNRLSEGKASVFDAYDATTKARKASENLQLKFSSIEVPNNLPKEIDKLLVESKHDLSAAYYSKTKALDAVLKFLDDQKPSNMQKFKDEMSLSDQFVLNGVTKIAMAKTSLGIDITVKK